MPWHTCVAKLTALAVCVVCMCCRVFVVYLYLLLLLLLITPKEGHSSGSSGRPHLRHRRPRRQLVLQRRGALRHRGGPLEHRGRHEHTAWRGGLRRPRGKTETLRRAVRLPQRFWQFCVLEFADAYRCSHGHTKYKMTFLVVSVKKRFCLGHQNDFTL